MGVGKMPFLDLSNKTTGCLERLADGVSAIGMSTPVYRDAQGGGYTTVIDCDKSTNVYPNPVASSTPLGVGLGVETWG